MGIFSKIFNRNNEDQEKVGGMNDYMTLVRVYFQAVLASRLGITNLSMLPDLRTSDLFFDEIDNSIKKQCKKVQDAQGYLYQFQAYTQDLMMLIGNLMKFKLRMPGFFKKLIYSMTEKTVNDIYNKNDYSDPGVVKTVLSVRQLSQRLGFSQKWATEFVYQIVLLTKKSGKK